MTEDEKKKQQQAQPTVTATTTATTEQPKKEETTAATTEQPKKKKEPPIWQTNAAALRKRAGELRDYASSPVNIDTSGQTDYWHDFMNSRVAREQQQEEADRPSREKRERTARRLAALTDGIVAISNVIGASQGATPITQTPLSSAHKAAVDEAVKRRNDLADKYEVARKNALTLAQKRDAENEKRRKEEREARRKAGEAADKYEAEAAKMENSGAAADRKYGLDEIKAQEGVRHNKATEANAATRNGIASSRETRLADNGGGGSKSDKVWDEYAAWRDAYPDEVEEIRSDNAQIDILGEPQKGVSETTAKQINARMRRKYGTPKKAKNSKGSALHNRGKSGSALHD